ncbi:hypothetical protein Vadar_014823 [Vaccinium darrowii]|uniref:Uncharacterized protein n=1 Tax=Vaccinium darrowii TaxID=229202 RepID=A0ACB7XHL2_9ERIC|nr:hypothetical protein Vadar_014823 [Vaccinium darrowii]
MYFPPKFDLQGVHHQAEVQTQAHTYDSYDSYNYEILNYDYAGASEDVDTSVSGLDTDVDTGVSSLDSSRVEDSPGIDTASMSEPPSLQPDTHNQSLVEDVPESVPESVPEFVPNSPKRNPPRSNKGIPKPVYEPELTSKAKYPMSQYVSTHRLSESSIQLGDCDHRREQCPEVFSNVSVVGQVLPNLRRWIPDTKSIWRMGFLKSVKKLCGKKSDKSNNHEIVVAQPAESKTADGTVHLVEERLDRMDMEAESLRRKINTLNAEQLQFEKSADETISTYASNVLLIMLFHGLGSVFLQLNYPYAGSGISFVMVVLFFYAFMVAYKVTLDKIERVSEFEKNLQRRQTDLQNEVTCFGAKIAPACSNGELHNLARRGALPGVWNRMNSLRMRGDTLQRDITNILELSNSKNVRMKSLSQIAVGALIYGICFPTIGYYCLCLVGFRRAGLQQY